MTEEESRSLQSIDSPVFVSFGGSLEGALGISDNIRQGIESTIKSLMQRGFDIIMLTGDTRTVAEKVASRLGIMRFEARMSPMQKPTSDNENLNIIVLIRSLCLNLHYLEIMLYY